MATKHSRAELVILTVCCTSLFMTTLDSAILNVALPSLQRNMHAPASGLQWTVSGYALLRGTTIVAAGSFADRFGRKRFFALGLIIFLIGSLACGLAPNLGSLIAFRCFQGFGSAVLTPSSLAIITNTFTEPKARAWAIGVWNAATGVSSTAGPIFGGVLVQAFGWRSVFLVNLPIGLVALGFIKVLRESKSAEPRPFDVPGQLAIAVALATLTYALISAPTAGWTSLEVDLLFAVSAISWGAFILIQRTSAHPLIALRYLRRPMLSGAALLAILAFTVFVGFSFLNTIYLQEVRGYSPLHAGLVTMPITIAVLLFSTRAGRMTGNHGPRRAAVLAMCFIAASMLALSWITVSTSIIFLLVVFFLLGIGNGFVNPPITTAAISSMPKDRAAVAGAVATMGRQIGNNLGVALLGSIVFSIASGINGSNGKAVAALLASKAGAAQFVHALRYGYAVATVLALAAIGVAMWALRPHPLTHTLVDGEYVETEELEAEETTP